MLPVHESAGPGLNTVQVGNQEKNQLKSRSV